MYVIIYTDDQTDNDQYKGAIIMNDLVDGKLLKKLREERGLTQEQVGERVGVTLQAVSKWEQNRSDPDLGMIPLLAKLYHVSADHLLGIENEADESLQYYADRIQNELDNENTQEAFEISKKLIERFPKRYDVKYDMLDVLNNISRINSYFFRKYQELYYTCWSPSSIEDYKKENGLSDEEFEMDPGDRLVTDEEKESYDEKMDIYYNGLDDKIQRLMTDMAGDIVFNSGDKELSMKCLTRYVDLCRETDQPQRAEELVNEATPIELCRDVLRAKLTESVKDNRAAVYKELKLMAEQSFLCHGTGEFFKADDEQRQKIFKDMQRMLDIFCIMFDDEEFGEFGLYVYKLGCDLGFICDNIFKDRDKAHEYYSIAVDAQAELENIQEGGVFKGGFFKGMPLKS